MLSRILTRRFAANYLSTLVFVGVAYWYITSLSDFHRGFLQARWDFGMFGIESVFTVRELLRGLFALYAVVLVPFYAAYPWLHSKAFVFAQGVVFALRRLDRPVSPARARVRAATPWRLPLRGALSPAARQAALTLLLKFYFAPLMINWCLSHTDDMVGTLLRVAHGVQEGLTGRVLFDNSLYWACFQIILFVDTFLFTLGYILESPALRNRIRSVDPTFFGWCVCLACYPPFNDLTSRFIHWQSNDFPHFESTAWHIAANVTLLVSMAIYSWATVALGFKASNLTNRGIVAHGPYSVVRHPAYAAKNFAWWIGCGPTFVAAYYTANLRGVALAILAMGGWTAIYVLRALTEERHLLMVDNGYADYMRKVPWRFIPRVI